MSWLLKWRNRNLATPAKQAPLPAPEVTLLSDRGGHRQNNQDCGGVIQAKNGASESRGLLVVVADGMGGHKAGEIASQTAVRTVTQVYQRAKGTPGEALDHAFQEANHIILQLANKNQEMTGMGTTCTALAIVGSGAWAAHVGDSRLYLVRGDEIYQLSEDHTAIGELVRRGLLSPDMAEHHEDRNVLVRAMGTKPELSIMRWRKPMDVKDGDAFVLCSDGLHDLVNDSEIRAVVKSSLPKDASRKLIQMAKDRGGFDNITVAIVSVCSNKSRSEALRDTRQVEVAP